MFIKMYVVSWDNVHASGIFPEVFRSYREAHRFAVDWRREMIAIEPTAKDQDEARHVYSWEILGVEFDVQKVYMWPGHAWYVYLGTWDQSKGRSPILRECPFRLVRPAIIGWMKQNMDKLFS